MAHRLLKVAAVGNQSGDNASTRSKTVDRKIGRFHLVGGHVQGTRENARSYETRTEDWQEFRTLDGCARKAGVAREALPALVAKELTDNGLDAGAKCDVKVEGAKIIVSDDGPGLEGSDATLAELFSIGRPMVSTKRLRRVTRGALGNGLRVVAGTVLASGGRLWVRTRGRRVEIVPKEDGSSEVRPLGKKSGSGTTVEVEFGGSLADLDEDVTLRWARQVNALAPPITPRECRSSPWWYTSDTFLALAQAAGDVTVRELVESLDGCSGPKAGGIAGEHRRKLARTLTLTEAEDVLRRARAATRRMKPERLGSVGRDILDAGFCYAKTSGEFSTKPGRGELAAEVPFIVECWARATDGEPEAIVCVNRTPTVADVTAFLQAWKGGAQTFSVNACGVEVDVKGAGRGRAYEVWVNVQCPALAFTTDGKAPDFSPLEPEFSEAITKAVLKAKRATPNEARSSPAADIVRVALERWEGEWKPGGIVPTVRQVFYALAVAGIVPKSQAGYKCVSKVLSGARKDGSYPWEGIADPLRQVRRVPMWASVEEYLAEMREGYRLDKWAPQPRRVEVWTEKDALTGALAPVAEELEVPLLVVRGYSSSTAKNEAVERLSDGKPTSVLYVGDFDPSGLNMFEGAERWIRERLDGARHVEFVRLAVTEDDFFSDDYLKLPVNDDDSRAPRYRERYGGEVMEAEALPPATLRTRIREAVLARRDDALWRAELEREAGQRAEVAHLMKCPPHGGSGKRKRSGR